MLVSMGGGVARVAETLCCSIVVSSSGRSAVMSCRVVVELYFLSSYRCCVVSSCHCGLYRLVAVGLYRRVAGGWCSRVTMGWYRRVAVRRVVFVSLWDCIVVSL